VYSVSFTPEAELETVPGSIYTQSVLLILSGLDSVFENNSSIENLLYIVTTTYQSQIHLAVLGVSGSVPHAPASLFLQLAFPGVGCHV
jgi:hypothetical protein